MTSRNKLIERYTFALDLIPKTCYGICSFSVNGKCMLIPWFPQPIVENEKNKECLEISGEVK